MKNSVLIPLLLALVTSAFAQRPNNAGRGQQGPSINGRVTGTLIDTTSNEPIEFATIVLVDAKTQEQKDGTMSESDGSFKMPEVKLGAYELHISFLGYRNKIVKGIELTPKNPDYDVETVYLLSEGVTLEEVEVTAESATIENRIDKIVYNADKDVTTQGGDAAEVLQRVPLLSVDFDGNVSLRGSSNIQILINGKPSTIFSGSIGDALKTIPADQIKSVEVITTPTAKYDGEGTAGIVNIITKKKTAQGFTGTINTSVGTRSNRGSLNLGYTRGRFGLNLNGSGWYNWPRESFNDFYREDYTGDETRVLDQSGAGESQFYGPRASIGAFYDINAYNSINSSFNFRGFGRNSEQLTEAFFNDPVNDLNQEYLRNSDTRSFRNGFDWTTDYRRTFKQPEKELSFAFQISGDRSNSENEFIQKDQLGDSPELNISNFNQNKGLNLEYTLQTDYVHPFSDAVKLETGAKGVLRRIDSDYSYENFGDGVAIPDTADVFYYDQDVLAGYASFNFKFGENWGMIAGTRYEYTTISGDFDKDPLTFGNNYGNLLPSVILNRKLGQFSNLKVSYGRRIQRPSLFFVNPYLQLNDPREVTIGNPQLDPELTDQFELSYNTYIKGLVLNGSVYYRFTDDVIESFTRVTEEGVSLNTFQNIGVERSIGFNFFSSFTVKKWLTLRGGFNIFSYNAESRLEGVDLQRQALVWRGNLNATASLPRDFKVEAFGFYNSPRQTLQGQRASYSRFSFGVKKELWDSRGSIGMSVSQPFSKFLAFPSELQGDNFIQQSEFKVLVRSFNLNFSYRFGKLDFKDRRSRRSKIDNDDLKGGGGGNNF